MERKRISIFFIALVFLIGLFSYGQLCDFLLGQRKIDRYVYPTDFSDCLVASQKRQNAQYQKKYCQV